MSWQDELRETARKRALREQLNKIIILIIVLIAVIVGIHFLGKKIEQSDNSKAQIKLNSTQQQSIPSVDETE